MQLDTVHRWHVRVWGTSPRIVRKSFEHSGFAVDPLPENIFKQSLITVSHASAAAITVWLLKHAQLAQHVTIEDV